MHARIDELLSLRDGEPVDAGVAQHAGECQVCAAELTRLRQMQQRLQLLGSLDPPPLAPANQVSLPAGSWSAGQGAGGRRIGWAVAAGLVLAIAISMTVRTSGVAPERAATTSLPTQLPAPLSKGVPATPAAASAPSTVNPSTQRQPAALEQLVAQSQELDKLLQFLPERPSIERVAMAATIDTMEQRIQWLDVQLSYAPETGLNDSQAYRLWRERVDLMDSLVKVRYAEGQHLNF